MSAKGQEARGNLSEMYDPANPYAAGRKEFNDQYGRLAKNAASWRRMAFLMFVLLAVSLGVVLWMAQSVKVVPFIVQVDQHGYQVAVQAVVASDGMDDRVIMSRIADFVTNTRSIYADRTALVALITKAYDSIETGSPALGKLDAYFRENNPLAKSDIVVDITINSVLRAAPEGNKLWQAEWSEMTFDQGKLKGERFFKGTFAIEPHSPTNIKEIMRNPLGIFISDFHITEKLN